MSFHTEMEQFSYEMIEEFGQEIELYHTVDQYNEDYSKNTYYTELTTTMRGVITDYSLSQIGSTLVLQEGVELEALGGPLIVQGDKQLLIHSREGLPVIGDEVVVGAIRYSVINVGEINPAGTSLLCKLQIRSLRLADAKFIKLAYLTPGDKVKDPAQDLIWRVVAQNHFGTYLTLLVTDHLLPEPIMFDDFRLVPWESRDLRVYLRGAFYGDLTDNFKAIIEECTTVTGDGYNYTNPDVDDETIFTLSATEMGSTSYNIDPPDGTHIPYFSSDSRRIATAASLPKEYWTRTPNKSSGAWDEVAYVIKAGGGWEYYYCDNTTIRVRPAVNLQGNTMVVQNIEGIYELQY